VGAVTKTGDNQVVVRAINYMAHVHAFSLLEDDAVWFPYTVVRRNSSSAKRAVRNVSY
jgi:hypothetical protein